MREGTLARFIIGGTIRRGLSSSSSNGKKRSLPTKPILPYKTDEDKQKKSISQFFVDYKMVKTKAGKGGDGIVSFMHLKENEFAGPDGGDGGNGAHIIFEVNKGLKSLNKLQSIYEAEEGGVGRHYHMRGKDGRHLQVAVPDGTVIKNELGEIVVELNAATQPKHVVARGGSGGKGNAYFLSNLNRRPTQSEPGRPGQQFIYHVELKLIADAALIGHPNVGKSSLLNALTRARAKIGDYSFTTLHPQVGCVQYEDYLQISVADLPGLLADLTRGLGTKYLHHLDKCKMLLFVLDVSMPRGDHGAPMTLLDQYTNMSNVLNTFDARLMATKPVIVIAHKIDSVIARSADEQLAALRQHLTESHQGTDLPAIPTVIAMSAEKKINLVKFLKLLRSVYEKTTTTTTTASDPQLDHLSSESSKTE